jgi:hypothetical protein
MKSFITPTYTFTPGISGVGTINLSGINNFNVNRLVAIINQTTGSLIYSTADPNLDFTSLSGTTLTLQADTSTQSANDEIQIIYDVDDALNNNELIEAIESLRIAIGALTRSGIGQSLPDVSGRLRIALDSITANLTLATITTLGTLSNQTQVGSISATEQVPSLMRLGADSMRRNINVT